MNRYMSHHIISIIVFLNRHILPVWHLPENGFSMIMETFHIDDLVVLCCGFRTTVENGKLWPTSPIYGVSVRSISRICVAVYHQYDRFGGFDEFGWNIQEYQRFSKSMGVFIASEKREFLIRWLFNFLREYVRYSARFKVHIRIIS